MDINQYYSRAEQKERLDFSKVINRSSIDEKPKSKIYKGYLDKDLYDEIEKHKDNIKKDYRAIADLQANVDSEEDIIVAILEELNYRKITNQHLK